MAQLTDEELLDTLETQLPALLERHPELEMRVYSTFMRTFATKQEVAAVLSELREFRGEFDAFRQEVDDQFETVDERFDRMDQRFSDLKDWVEMVVGRFQTRSGRKLEDVVAGTLRLALERDDIVSENVRLRQPLEDIAGTIGPEGRRYEVDILVDNGALLMFEVKSVCEVEDVDRFGDKVGLMRALHPDKTVAGAIVTMAPLDEVASRCAEWASNWCIEFWS